MPSFKLNGQDIPFAPGDTVMQAAWKAGIEIPHYCWHPGLSVAANCRMCLVHIESGRQMALPVLKFDEGANAFVATTKPKLQPACQLAAQEGMEISSENDEVKKAQASVQEFLLLNHPVDCPICDQAGECKLQDYYYEHQNTLKRKETEPVHKPKGVRFGPTIVYDAERCIMCTRCIRVCDELVGDSVLDMRERGNKNEIVLAPGRELDHRYTLMTEHVCPVGALTSRDFRFKARVWFLKSAQSICMGCATGCNDHVDYDPRSSKIHRLRPRDNEEVNRFWMCDDGMMSYQRQHKDRIVTAFKGRAEERHPVLCEEAIEHAAAELREVEPSRIAVVLSAQQSTEDNFAAVKLARALGIDRLYLAALPDWEGDEILRHVDQNPNRRGAEYVADRELQQGVAELLQAAQSGEVSAVIALGSASQLQIEELATLTNLKPFVSFAANIGALPALASTVIPTASWAEAEGIYINAKGLRQRTSVVVPPPAGVEPMWQAIAALAKALGHDFGWSSVAQVRAETFPVQEAAQ